MTRHAAFPDFLTRETVASPAYLSTLSALLFLRSQEGKSEIVLKKEGETPRVLLSLPGLSSPVVSPDEKRLAFLAVSETGRQLYVMDLLQPQTAPVCITSMRHPVMDPQWSPDGKWLLFTSPAAEEDDEQWLLTPASPGERPAWDPALDPVAITDFGYKFDGLGFARPSVLQLWVVPADASQKPHRISHGPANFMHALFAADSRHVICESNLYCDKKESIAMDVLSIDRETGEMTRITRDKMVVSYPNPVRPLALPGGGYVIGILDYGEKSTHTNEAGYPACTLYRVSGDASTLTPITRQTPDCFDTVQFAYNAGIGAGMEKVQLSSDGTSVFFLAGYMGQGTVYCVPLAGESQAPVRLTDSAWCYNGLRTAAGPWLLASRAASDTPEQYVLLHGETGEVRVLYQSSEAWLREIPFSRASDFSVPTLDGESRVHGWVLPPQEMEEGKKYPCIVYVHGGPHPFYTDSFDLEMQCFAGAGFGLIFCNPRGSSGYGDRHRNMARAFDGSAYTDILQFVHEAGRRFSWIDMDRLGLTGGSYGGYMTNYAATRCSLFRAYITQRSTVNALISYASSDMQGSSADFPSYGEFMDHEVERSEIVGMEKVSAPFLILHGMNDLRCPVEGAHQLFVALKDSHAPDFPVKLVLYPHTAHNQPTERRQQQHYYRTMLEWFKTYL
ncbi:MAG: S9 family peptidase [Clostridia bacterium]|nr:S9 family peptidase [Clostridia bacterium]